jgi:acetyl esterase/lipase
MTTVTRSSNIPSAEAGDAELQPDLYRSDIEGPVPAVISLYGGGWGCGDKASDAQMRLKPLAAHGVAVLSANYNPLKNAITKGTLL